jgi:hypothetical protein
LRTLHEQAVVNCFHIISSDQFTTSFVHSIREALLCALSKYIILITYLAVTVGTTRIPNLQENIGSSFVKLTPEEVDEIAAAVPHHEVAGARLNERLNSHAFLTTPPLDSYVAPR